MKIKKPKNLILVLSFLAFINCYSQTNFKKVTFEVYYEKNQSLPGAKLTVKDSNPEISIHTDFNGKAELNLTELNVEIELYILGPYIKFDLMENVDFVKVNIEEKTIIYYFKNKKVKKKKLKIKGC